MKFHSASITKALLNLRIHGQFSQRYKNQLKKLKQALIKNHSIIIGCNKILLFLQLDRSNSFLTYLKKRRYANHLRMKT